MSWLTKALDPANVFGTRKGGIDVNQMIDPGGAAIETFTGKTFGRDAAHTGDLLGIMHDEPIAPPAQAAQGNVVPVKVGGLSTLSALDKPSDNHAQVTLALWDDYKTNFAPYQYEMLNNLTTQNPALVGETVGKAQGLVNKAFDVAKGNRDVTLSRFGMAPTGQVAESMERQSDLARSAAQAGAANTTRMDLKQRDMDLMTSGVPNVAGRSYGMTGG